MPSSKRKSEETKRSLVESAKNVNPWHHSLQGKIVFMNVSIYEWQWLVMINFLIKPHNTDTCKLIFSSFFV